MESQNIHVYLKIKIIAQKLADPSSIPQEKLELHVTNKRNYYNCQKRIKRYSKKKSKDLEMSVVNHVASLSL